MVTENLSTLKIHKLTQAQYDRELTNGTIDENALYLTPDEEIDLTPYATKDDVSSTYETKTDASAKLTEAKTYTDEMVSGKADSSALSNFYTKSQVDNMELISMDDIDTICGATIQVASLSEVTF